MSEVKPPKVSNIGRPTKMTPDTLKKLEEAFLVGASDREACFFADISPQTLYTYQNDNPDFLDRKEALKENPIFIARQTVIKAVKTDPEMALKYLERKNKKEFSPRTEQSGPDGEALPPILVKFIGADGNPSASS
jgi:hypothetical protein